MSETLVAILLVTHSATGSNLIYRWPPLPATQPRLARPRPIHDTVCIHADNPWRAAYNADTAKPCQEHAADDDEYLWRRPNLARERAASFNHGRSHPTSRRASPSKDLKESLTLDNDNDSTDDYDELLGYTSKLLAGILCPPNAMCNQKFEVVVDDLAFLGHPVRADSDGCWRFPSEKPKATSRGRGSRKGQTQSPMIEEQTLSAERAGKEQPSTSSWLQIFHLVLVLDRPDPSSSAAGNLEKYFDILYEEIAFAMTAVLYQEQVLHNLVAIESEKMGALKESYFAQSRPYKNYLADALKESSIASAIKTVYEAIKVGDIARFTIGECPLELQLPPYLDSLLHSDDPLDTDYVDREADEEDAFGGAAYWGTDMSHAWRLPALTPWKALLRLDDDKERGYELYMKVRGPQLNSEDRDLAEQLMRFLDMASITFSLADLASLLNWQLENQVYPTVRWLIRHRRAKIVDVVHPGLRTIFALPQTMPAPISKLTAEFARAFSHPALPPLPQLLSQISTSTSTSAHFYGAVVRSRDMIPLYYEVVIWLLKRDLLVTMHLRIRVVATPELKERVRMRRDLDLARRGRVRSRSFVAPGSALDKNDVAMKQRRDSESKGSEGPDGSPVDYWMSMSPKSARAQARRASPKARTYKRDRSLSLMFNKPSDPSGKDGGDEGEDDGLFDEDSDLPFSVGADFKHPGWDEDGPTMIPDPARANAVEQLWLSAMSDGISPYIARRFEQINQFFDGKCSDDEILYKAGISRKQLREVLHHYDEYLQTFLHPA